MNRRLKWGALLLLSATTIGSALGQAEYSIQDLGLPPGATNTVARALNGNGDVVGEVEYTYLGPGFK